VLTLDGKSAAPSMQLVMETAGLYDLRADEARAIVDSTCEVASTWRERAVRMGLPKGDIELTAAAFNARRL
jgi:serine/threonine-protein kinase HipA